MNLSRREFLMLASALAACRFPQREKVYDDPTLPSLGGAPDTRDGRVVAAFVDVVVPGKHRDPEGVLGALDVNAAAKFFEEGSQVQILVPLLVAALDGYSDEYASRDFLSLAPSDREEVIAYAVEKLPELEFAVQLAKVAYYSAPETCAAFGYPGANGGYISDENFGFRREMARPHPLTVLNGGNLP